MHKPLLFKSLIKDPVNTSYEGKDRDETVKILIRRSPLSIVGWVLISIILFFIPFFLGPYLSSIRLSGEQTLSPIFIFSLEFFWYVALFGFVFQNFLNWYFEVLLVTNKKIIDIDKGATNISETPLDNVQDVTSKMTSVLGQVFNIGSIHIQTAAEREEFEFSMIDNPSAARDTISDLISKNGGHRHGIN